MTGGLVCLITGGLTEFIGGELFGAGCNFGGAITGF